MTITPQIKERIVAALLEDMVQREMQSQAEYAKYIAGKLGIKFDKAAFSQIKKAEGRNAIKDASWLKLARHFGLLSKRLWIKANTKTFQIVTTAIDLCQKYGIWQVLCDNAGIGKTFAAKYFADKNKSSSVYIDCSQCLSKSDFIVEFARAMGIEHTGTYNQLWREATDAFLLLENPVLILDEFGDVPDSVITLLKSLYNKADFGDRIGCGLYLIGADNLKKRLVDGRKRHKQSYAEFWSRFDNYITDLDFSDKRNVYLEELREDIEMIVDANLPEELIGKRDEIIVKTLNTCGSRAIRNKINIQLAISNLNAS